MDTAGCKASIKGLLLANIPAPTGDQITAADTLAGGIADAVAAMVGTATITYISGLVDASGPVTGVFEGNIS